MYLPSLEAWFRKGERQKIVSELARICPTDPLLNCVDEILDVMEGRTVTVILEGRHVSSEDRLFLENIILVSMKISSMGDIKSLVSTKIGISDNNYDFLDKQCRAPWSIAKIMNFISLSRIKPTRNSAVVATMRDDGVSILQFVAHYRALGFEHIFIFSNDNCDGSSEMFVRLSELGLISFINNPIGSGTSPQRKAFEYSLHFLNDLRDYEWVFYLDSDEFFIPNEEKKFDIKSIISSINTHFPKEPPSAMLYFWKWFGGHAFAREQGLFLERFQYSRGDSHVKSLVKLFDISSMSPLHYPILKGDSFFCDSEYNRISSGKVRSLSIPNYRGGQINHYWHKSFQEFAIKKTRGDSLGAVLNEYKREFEQFFLWNVPAIPERRDPCSSNIIAKIKVEMDYLLSLPGVGKLNGEIERQFNERMSAKMDDDELYVLFEGMKKKYPKLGLA